MATLITIHLSSIVLLMGMFIMRSLLTMKRIRNRDIAWVIWLLIWMIIWITNSCISVTEDTLRRNNRVIKTRSFFWLFKYSLWLQLLESLECCIKEIRVMKWTKKCKLSQTKFCNQNLKLFIFIILIVICIICVN